jgi:hypothetical protein
VNRRIFIAFDALFVDSEDVRELALVEHKRRVPHHAAAFITNSNNFAHSGRRRSIASATASDRTYLARRERVGTAILGEPSPPRSMWLPIFQTSSSKESRCIAVRYG